MIHFELTWRQAALVAVSLGCVSIALRLARRPRLAGLMAFSQESGLILGLFALWQLAGSFTIIGPGDALARSRWIWHFERVIGLPSETSLQRIFLPHPVLIEFFNLYYLGLHFPVLIGCMVWLFVRHRDSYRRFRTTLVAFTSVCLVIQFIPVAPPRMLPSTGLVDTAVRYHQSVYSSVAGFDPDQLSAMPSVHVGWAILVAVAVITTARTSWRWLVVLYPVVTTLAVVVTANHFWLDGIAAAALLILVMIGQSLLSKHLAARRSAARRPGERRPLVVAYQHAHALGENRGERDELAGADDGSAQRLRVDDDAQRRTAQVRSVHSGLAEVGPDEVGTGERTFDKVGVGEVHVAQDARLEHDVPQPRAAEIHRIELAPAEHDSEQVGAEDLGTR